MWSSWAHRHLSILGRKTSASTPASWRLRIRHNKRKLLMQIWNGRSHCSEASREDKGSQTFSLTKERKKKKKSLARDRDASDIQRSERVSQHTAGRKSASGFQSPRVHVGNAKRVRRRVSDCKVYTLAHHCQVSLVRRRPPRAVRAAPDRWVACPPVSWWCQRRTTFQVPSSTVTDVLAYPAAARKASNGCRPIAWSVIVANQGQVWIDYSACAQDLPGRFLLSNYSTSRFNVVLQNWPAFFPLPSSSDDHQLAVERRLGIYDERTCSQWLQNIQAPRFEIRFHRVDSGREFRRVKRKNPFAEKKSRG